ncbi:transactivator protein [Vernonia yellow vein virus]|uniref:Transcriptional activator protein n=1 Tax=Vernonia yellow vein virus TaxID=367061 RepID=Q2MCS4_9GEMI|nr:transactivator protein [Vernonia yellow vein virus]CAJ57821.2 transactivator protein [Vernonia yellow vein virus]
MQPSSPYTSRCSQVPIKALHRAAKARPIKRKRIDLPCGCSIYRHINCHNHGFTHRGTHHCSSSSEWRIYLGSSKSPIFQDPKAPTTTIQHEQGHHRSQDPIQPLPEESTGTTQMLSDFHHLESLTSSDIAFLKSI